MENRYSRQQLFSLIGERGQNFIRQKHVLIVGLGALGSASAEALVRAGIGELTIIDRDYVECSNLQRQQLYHEEDALKKLPKAIAAYNRLSQINSDVKINAHIMDVRADNLEGLLNHVHVIIDATDNFDIRFILNDFSQKYKIPWIYGSCVGSFGVSYTIIPEVTPCLHCVLKAVPMTGVTCDTAGIISPAVQMVVAYQIAECMKILVEDYSSLRDTYIAFDLWNNQHHAISVKKLKDENCSSCGNNPTYPFLSYEWQTKTEVLCGRNTVQIRPPRKMSMNFSFLQSKLEKLGEVKRNPYLLSLQLNEMTMVFFQDGRVFVHGTNDMLQAKNLYYKVLG